MRSRPSYVRKIRPFIDKPVVKVRTGMCRVGKSGLLELIQQELLAAGTNESRIVHFDLESMEYADLQNDTALFYDTLRKRIGKWKVGSSNFFCPLPFSGSDLGFSVVLGQSHRKWTHDHLNAWKKLRLSPLQKSKKKNSKQQWAILRVFSSYTPS